MALSQRLEFRQSQALVMTPQLLQAIKLLQLSSLDLAAYVEAELEKNPLLERVGGDEETPASAETDDAGEAGEVAEWTGESELGESRSSLEASLGTGLENVFPDEAAEKSTPPEAPPASAEWSGAGSAAADDDYNLEAFVWPRSRSPIIWPSRWCWRSPIPRAA